MNGTKNVFLFVLFLFVFLFVFRKSESPEVCQLSLTILLS